MIRVDFFLKAKQYLIIKTNNFVDVTVFDGIEGSVENERSFDNGILANSVETVTETAENSGNLICTSPNFLSS